MQDSKHKAKVKSEQRQQRRKAQNKGIKKVRQGRKQVKSYGAK